jgi:paraquat-inducible protein B
MGVDFGFLLLMGLGFFNWMSQWLKGKLHSVIPLLKISMGADGMHTAQHGIQQINQARQIAQQLIQQTQQGSQQYRMMLQQEQQNIQMLEQILQREKQAVHSIEQSLQNHHLAIQRCQEVINVCNQMQQELTGGVGAFGNQGHQPFMNQNQGHYQPHSYYGGQTSFQQ